MGRLTPELQEKTGTTGPAEALVEIEQLVAGRRDRGLVALKPHLQLSRKAYSVRSNIFMAHDFVTALVRSIIIHK